MLTNGRITSSTTLGTRSVARVLFDWRRATQAPLYDVRMRNLYPPIEPFDTSNPRLIAGERISLVDDVFTTGETVSTCAAPLKAAGAQEVLSLPLRARKRNKQLIFTLLYKGCLTDRSTVRTTALLSKTEMVR
jgi:hypothetical protein